MKIGDLVRVDAEQDEQFHGAKGIIVNIIESGSFKQGFHYEIQTLDGYTIVALAFEVEHLENEVKIPN